MPPTIRTIEADELHPWMSVARQAMLGVPPTAELVESRQKSWELDRCFAAYDREGRLCGTSRTFTTELTVPGGALPAGALSAVGVLTTHRRQGNLSALMKAQLDDSVEREESVSVLVAAEYPIYGRYGYGPATEACNITLEAPGAAGWIDPPTGEAEFVDTDTFLPEIRDLYDRARYRYSAHITYGDEQWDTLVGAATHPWADDQKRRQDAPKVLWRDATGEVQGAAMYAVDDTWIHNRPQGTLTTDALVSATDEAEREIVRFLASVDWVKTVKLGLRPVDDALPLMLVDGRYAGLDDRSDHVWARILDVPVALSTRRYATSGGVVFEVVDPGGYAGGRFELVAGPDGAECRATTNPADLVVPVTALGAAYLGGHSWAKLAAAGWVQEERDGAVATASALFTTPRSPWCAATF